MENSPWDYTECAIMRVDRFAKLFLDPDGDGNNYLEFQCNPLNIYFDSWYKQGFFYGMMENIRKGIVSRALNGNVRVY